MKKKKLRVMAVLLAMIVCVTANPINAFAAPKLISRTTAISIAAKNAKANSKASSFKLKEAELDEENGIKIWDIEFFYKGAKYEYEINARTKKILSKEKEISISKVKQIALKKAKVKSKNVKLWKIDHKDAKNYYNVTFSTSKKYYTLQIHSANGKILKYKNIDKKSSAYIKLAEAKEIALKHAKENASLGTVTYTSTELEKDGGRTYYEISFISNGYEFEYDIHPTTGNILDWEIEPQDQAD